MSKVIFIYKPHSEHARAIEEYLHDFFRQTGKQLETIDPDTREGVALCEVYDIIEYPSIIALSDDGHIQNSWRGLPPIPTISELTYYT